MHIFQVFQVVYHSNYLVCSFILLDINYDNCYYTM